MRKGLLLLLCLCSYGFCAEKRVLFVLPGMYVGGTEIALINMLNALPYPGREVDLCVLNGTNRLQHRLRHDIACITPREASRRHYHTLVLYATGLNRSRKVAKLHAKKCVQWLHFDFANARKLPSIVSKAEAAHVDEFVCVSKLAQQRLCAVCPWLREKTSVVYNLIDDTAIHEKAKKHVRDMSVRHDVPTVVTVCRLTPVKGLLRALDVQRRLFQEGIYFRWYVVGEGRQREALQRRIREYNLTRDFILLGERTNPYPYVARADIFALLSLNEGFGIAVTEAKLLAKPIIVTSFAGAKEQIDSGENGLIVENTEEAIYQGLKYLLSDKHAQQKFSKSLKDFSSNSDRSLAQIKKIIEQ